MAQQKLFVKNCIFDLDGTLIDSRPGLVDSLAFALHSENIILPKEFNLGNFIGPKLRKIFELISEKLSAQFSEEIFSRLEISFKQKYDLENYKNAILYPKVYETLNVLKNHGLQMFIATNKRSDPTRKVLNHFQIDKFFERAYSIDSLGNLYQNKSQLVSKIMELEKISADETIYIGDSDEDFQAAEHNGLKFFYASYGFGKTKNFSRQIDDFDCLQEIFNGKINSV